MKKGKFIVIDGSEGAGKTSQIEKLKEKFDAVFSREPGGTPYADEIRNLILKSDNAGQADAKTLFALFWASRADHMKNKIIPALESGKNVIVDRFDSSTFAYQIYGQKATELEEEFITFRDFFLGEYKPDIYIYLDVDTKTGLARKSNQPDQINHFEQRDIDFFDRMREGFQEFFKHVPYKVINANLDFEAVAQSLEKVIQNEIKK